MKRNQSKRGPGLPVVVSGIIRILNYVGRLLSGIKVPVGLLSEESMLQTAIRKTGFSDFGDERFRLPFQILLRSYRQEGRLNFLGRILIKRRLLSGLINRLLITNKLKQHPEVRDVKIQQPFFIVSMPRTGTTFLHKLLAQDPHARPLLTWEGLWPAYRTEKFEINSDPRLARLRNMVKLLTFLAPQLRIIHDIDPDGPEECVPLLKNTFALAGIWPPSYCDWFLNQPPSSLETAYREYRQQLQLIQIRRPQEGHWLLKAPFHLYGIEPLLKLFPDSVIIMIHRDPYKSVASLCSLADFMNSLISDDLTQKNALGSIVFNWATEGLRRAEAAREHAEPGRIYDIQYEELVQDPIATVKRLYSHTGNIYSQEFDTCAKAWLKEHPQNKYGKHQYSLEKYGLTREMIDDAFSWYCERYQIRRESAS